MGNKEQPQKPTSNTVREVPLGVVRLMKHTTSDTFSNRPADKPKPSDDDRSEKPNK